MLLRCKGSAVQGVNGEQALCCKVANIEIRSTEDRPLVQPCENDVDFQDHHVHQICRAKIVVLFLVFRLLMDNWEGMDMIFEWCNHVLCLFTKRSSYQYSWAQHINTAKQRQVEKIMLLFDIVNAVS